MAARNAKNVQKSDDWIPPQPDHASTLNTNYTRSQKSEILWQDEEINRFSNYFHLGTTIYYSICKKAWHSHMDKISFTKIT